MELRDRFRLLDGGQVHDLVFLQHGLAVGTERIRLRGRERKAEAGGAFE